METDRFDRISDLIRFKCRPVRAHSATPLNRAKTPARHEAIEVYIESLVAYDDPIPGLVEIERVTVAA